MPFCPGWSPECERRLRRQVPSEPHEKGRNKRSADAPDVILDADSVMVAGDGLRHSRDLTRRCSREVTRAVSGLWRARRCADRAPAAPAARESHRRDGLTGSGALEGRKGSFEPNVVSQTMVAETSMGVWGAAPR